LFDGQLLQKLLLSYHPKSTNNEICFNNISPNSDNLKFSYNATILNGTKICLTNNVKDMIGCLGGIKLLFPLF
jgi:hypothetical protein